MEGRRPGEVEDERLSVPVPRGSQVLISGNMCGDSKHEGHKVYEKRNSVLHMGPNASTSFLSLSSSLLLVFNPWITDPLDRSEHLIFFYVSGSYEICLENPDVRKVLNPIKTTIFPLYTGYDV